MIPLKRRSELSATLSMFDRKFKCFLSPKKTKACFSGKDEIFPRYRTDDIAVIRLPKIVTVWNFSYCASLTLSMPNRSGATLVMNLMLLCGNRSSLRLKYRDSVTSV